MTVNASEIFGPERLGAGFSSGTFEFSNDGAKVLFAEGGTLWVSGTDGGPFDMIAQAEQGAVISDITISQDDQWVVFLSIKRIETGSDEFPMPEYGYFLNGVSINGGELVT